MSIEGRIAVDVGFSDSTTGTGSQSLKRITLASTDSYTTGKVAVVSGTCGTSAVSVSVAPSAYIDATGSAVSFSSVLRFAFASSVAALCSETDGSGVAISNGNRVSICDSRNGGTAGFSVSAYGGTGSYTLVIYGT